MHSFTQIYSTLSHKITAPIDIFNKIKLRQLNKCFLAILLVSFYILAKDKEALYPKKHLFSKVNLENISDE